MALPQTSIRSREVCMMRPDWQDFGDALAGIWPQARYYSCTTKLPSLASSAEPPGVTLYPHLLAVPMTPDDDVIMVFDPDWQPSFHKATFSAHPDARKWHWVMQAPPHPSVRFRIGQGTGEDSPNRIDTGIIHFYSDPASKEQTRLRGKFFRLHARFATNRRGLVLVDRSKPPKDRDRTAEPIPKTADAMWWCGLHAIEWARQDSDRMLFGNMRPDSADKS